MTSCVTSGQPWRPTPEILSSSRPSCTHVPLTDAWWQFPIFFPTRDTLTFSEHFLGDATTAENEDFLTPLLRDGEVQILVPVEAPGLLAAVQRRRDALLIARNAFMVHPIAARGPRRSDAPG